MTCPSESRLYERPTGANAAFSVSVRVIPPGYLSSTIWPSGEYFALYVPAIESVTEVSRPRGSASRSYPNVVDPVLSLTLDGLPNRSNSLRVTPPSASVYVSTRPSRSYSRVIVALPARVTVVWPVIGSYSVVIAGSATPSSEVIWTDVTRSALSCSVTVRRVLPPNVSATLAVSPVRVYSSTRLTGRSPLMSGRCPVIGPPAFVVQGWPAHSGRLPQAASMGWAPAV